MLEFSIKFRFSFYTIFLGEKKKKKLFAAIFLLIKEKDSFSPLFSLIFRFFVRNRDRVSFVHSCFFPQRRNKGLCSVQHLSATSSRHISQAAAAKSLGSRRRCVSLIGIPSGVDVSGAATRMYIT